MTIKFDNDMTALDVFKSDIGILIGECEDEYIDKESKELGIRAKLYWEKMRAKARENKLPNIHIKNDMDIRSYLVEEAYKLDCIWEMCPSCEKETLLLADSNIRQTCFECCQPIIACGACDKKGADGFLDCKNCKLAKECERERKSINKNIN